MTWWANTSRWNNVHCNLNRHARWSSGHCGKNKLKRAHKRSLVFVEKEKYPWFQKRHLKTRLEKLMTIFDFDRRKQLHFESFVKLKKQRRAIESLFCYSNQLSCNEQFRNDSSTNINDFFSKILKSAHQISQCYLQNRFFHARINHCQYQFSNENHYSN